MSRSSWSDSRTSSSTSSPLRAEPAEQGVGDRLRLLGDLLEHELVVAALLGGRGVPVDGVGLRLDGGAGEVGDRDARGRGRSRRPGPGRARRASRVCAMNAATSEPRKFSPVADARPPAGCCGGRRRACPARRRAWRRSVNAPSSRRQTARIASASRPGPSGALGVGGGQQVRDDLGVGLGGELDAGAPRSSARSAAKFSMIPLWITATEPSADRCGWALRSVGPPWVAQRVCPMPMVAGGQRAARRAPSPGWPACRPSSAELSCPSATTATPAES